MRVTGLVALLLALIFVPVYGGRAEQRLVSNYAPGPVPTDPWAATWAKARPIRVEMLPQPLAKPFNLDPSIVSLSVKSLHNGTWIAFLISWDDPSKDVTMYTDKFRDAVAVQVPVAGPAPITMGGPGARVVIFHWKADWQEDIDKGFQDVGELYPNFWIDWYPFVAGEPPYDINLWTNIEAQRYLTGWVLGNPRSQPVKRVAVEEQVAEGFSTLTTSQRQTAVGGGVYSQGRWNVVIARPFVVGDPNDPGWGPGRETTVAFAAWDGGKGEIGSRKSFSNWVPLKIEPVMRERVKIEGREKREKREKAE